MRTNYVLASFPADSARAGWVRSPELGVPLKLAYPTQFSLPGYGHIPYTTGSSGSNRSGVLHFTSLMISYILPLPWETVPF